MSRMASLATRLGARALAAGRVAIAVTGLEHIPPLARSFWWPVTTTMFSTAWRC